MNRRSIADASKRMRLQRERDTLCEIELRSELHRRGLRFRVNFPLIFDRRRRADITFTAQKVAVFVNGCFWHACNQHASWPERNAAWWRAKLERNRARDSDSDAQLHRAGWKVIRVWEHDDVSTAADWVESAVVAARDDGRNRRNAFPQR